MVTSRRIGRNSAAKEYRHPLLARISPFLSCLTGMPDPKATRPVRWTPLAASMAAVLMALNAGTTLAVRCEDALDCMGLDFARRARVGCTYNGLLKALERQASSVLPILKADLRLKARAAMKRIPLVSGWLLLAVDGSKEDLPRTLDHESEFGIGDNGAVPQAFVTSVVEVHIGLPWDWRIGVAKSSEKDHLIQMAPQLPAEALLLGDGNFIGYPVWSALQKEGRSFLIRVGGNAWLLKDLCPDAKIERRGDIVYAWPASRQNKAEPLRLRLLKVGSKSNPVYLLTNVLDRSRLSKRAAGKIYRLRWGSELFYRTLKRTMSYAKLNSKASRRARIELEWGLIAAAVLVLFGAEALAARKSDVRRLSLASLLRALRKALLQSADGDMTKMARKLQKAVAASVRDTYKRRASKASRHRPPTKNTPNPLKLKPPRVRCATATERRLAREKHPALAA